MNNKVGIITFHKAHNYGAVLQAYALYKKLKLMGFEPEFIQDNSDYILNKYRFYPNLKNNTPVKYLRAWVGLLLNFRKKKQRFNAFQNFISKELPVCNNADRIIKYDSVVLGSDQIWNFNITGGIQDLYFGIYEKIETKNTISYAASMGNGMSESNFTSLFESKLKTLQNIGVREAALSAEISNRFNLESAVNLDPTLLLDKTEWDKLAIIETNVKPYLLVYEVEKNQLTPQVIEYIKAKLNLEVKVISSKINRASQEHEISTASPVEFLSLFKNASFVITTSFHGTVFSIINEIPFYTLKFGNGVDLRSSGLLASVGLDERHISSMADIKKIKVDFIPAREKLNTLKSNSEKYLTMSLL